MNRPANLLNILATVLIIEASVFSALLIVNDVRYAAQVTGANTTGNGVPPNCGDDIVDMHEGEECDDGADNGQRNSSCSTCCITKPVGQVRGGDDDDDDENRKNYCECGNGYKEWPEQCDKGGNNGRAGSECNHFCKEIDLCGNGQRDKDERCDDGNADNEDGCTNECRLPECGDGFKQSSNNEDCDDGNDNDNDGCSQDCQREECGDYITQNNEECDKGKDNNDQNECTSTCKKARCGDGLVQPSTGEECDNGSTENITTSECTADCKIREKEQEPRCGDKNVDSNEECDDGNTDNTDTCTNDCRNARCGDEYVQSSRNEQCDDGSSNGPDAAGNVRCTTTCTYPPPPPPPPPPVDDDDDGSSSSTTTNNQQVHPAPPSSQPTNLNELREKKEVQEKQLREAMLKAREEAEKRAQNAEENDDGETVVEENNDDGLHCFDSAGNVVTDRSRCDRGQEQYLLHRQNVSDEEIRKELNRKLLGDNATEEKRMYLLESLESARIRMDKMYASGNYDGEVQAYFEASIAWLDRVMTYFSTGDRTLEEIQQMAEPVRQLVEQASALVQQKLNLPGARPDINPIVVKTERLVRKFRESFIALAQGGVKLNQEALQKYTEAANLFANVKILCAEDANQCSHIDDVLEILKLVRTPLQEQLKNNPEIYRRIQENFEQ